jgi:hypothetical protein
MVSPKMDLIILNFVLNSKKKGWCRLLQFYFFLNHVLHKSERTQENTMRKTPNIFLKEIIQEGNIVLLLFLASVVY